MSFLKASQRSGVKCDLHSSGWARIVGRAAEDVRAQVHDLAQLDATAQRGILGVGDRRALVEPVVLQLGEVLGADVVVVRVPPVLIVAEVERTEVPVGAERQHAEEHQQAIAQLLLLVRPALAGEVQAPAEQRAARHRQDHLEPGAGLVLPPVEVVPGARHDRRLGRVDGAHRGRERRRHLAIGRELGDRVEPVALPLSDAQVTRHRRCDLQSAAAQAVPTVRRVLDLDQDLEALAVERPEDLVGVVGVRLQVDGGHGRGLAKVVGQRAGARLQHRRGGRVPLRALGGHRAVGHQVGVRPQVLPLPRLAPRQQVARAAPGAALQGPLGARDADAHQGYDRKQHP